MMGSMTVHPDIDQLVAKLRVLMPDLEARFHVEHIALFGSYVHGEQTPRSDLDVKVDLVMEEALKPTIGRRILKDLVPV